MAATYFRLHKQRSMKEELSQFIARVSYSVAQAAVQTYASAGFEAFICCLPGETMLTRLNAKVQLEGFPDALKFSIINHGKGNNLPVLEANIEEAVAKGSFKTAFKFRSARAREKPDNASVKANVSIQNKQLARSLVQSSKAGSKSKVKKQVLHFYTTRLASQEPLLAALLAKDNLSDLSLLQLHLMRVKQMIGAHFVRQLENRLNSNGFRQLVLQNMDTR